MSWFDDNSPLSDAEQTYANQTAAREAYYNANPKLRPVFSADQQAGLDAIVGGPVDSRPGPSGASTMPVREFIDNWRKTSGITLRQSEKAGWDALQKALKDAGYKDTIDVRTDGYNKGIYLGGDSTKFVKLLDGRDNWIWKPGGDSGSREPPGEPPGGGTNLANLGLPHLFAPFTETFAQPTFTPPPDFKAPTMNEAMQDPSIQFALTRGQEALERSASAKGTLLTTGTLRNLDEQQQGIAMQGYGDIYGRRAGEYESKYGKKVEGFERDYNQALGEYGIRQGNFYASQDRPFNKLATFAGMGQLAPQNYAGQYGNLMMAGANQAGNYLTQGANAQAAGQVSGSNAWNQAFGNLGNLGMQAAYMYNNPWNLGRLPFTSGAGSYGMIPG